MVGRGAQGRPGCPGRSRAISRPASSAAAPPLAEQLDLVAALYEEMLAHHGARIGVRHARKHLGWALDAAAETAGVSPEHAQVAARAVLTADDPARSAPASRRRLSTRFGWRAAA